MASAEFPIPQPPMTVTLQIPAEQHAEFEQLLRDFTCGKVRASAPAFDFDANDYRGAAQARPAPCLPEPSRGAPHHEAAAAADPREFGPTRAAWPRGTPGDPWLQPALLVRAGRPRTGAAELILCFAMGTPRVCWRWTSKAIASMSSRR